MAKKTQVLVIDDAEFEMICLGGVEGLAIFDRLTSELAEVMPLVLRAVTEKDGGEAKVGALMAQSLAKLPPDFKNKLRVTFAGLCKVRKGDMMLALGDGIKLDPEDVFDQHFAGRFAHMVRWLLACLKWSFGDFLPSSSVAASTPPTTTP